jgi:hypothetical protein
MSPVEFTNKTQGQYDTMGLALKVDAQVSMRLRFNTYRY